MSTITYNTEAYPASGMNKLSPASAVPLLPLRARATCCFLIYPLMIHHYLSHAYMDVRRPMTDQIMNSKQ